MTPLDPTLQFRTHCIAVAVSLLLVLTGGGAFAQTEVPGATERETPNAEPSSYESLFERSDLGNVAQAARVKLAEGQRTLKQAVKTEAKIAETADGEKRTKLEERRMELYEQAIAAFTEAIGFDKEMIEAYAGLGEALHRLGRLEEALQVHAMALRQFPEDLDNFRGWAHTLLALNLLGNATAAYTQYAESNPARAEILMSEMKGWVTEKRADPGELNPADVEKLASWIQQQQTGS